MKTGSRTEFADGIATIVLEGDLNMYSAKNLKTELLEFLAECRPELSKVHVDLQGIAELDSSGIALLAHVQKKANEMGVKLYILRPGRKIRRLFKLGFIDAILEILD